MSRVFYAFTVLVAGLALVGAGCGPEGQNNNNPPPEDNNENDAVYAGWQSYTNNDGGYAVKYPADFSLSEGVLTPTGFGNFPAVKIVIPERFFTGTNLGNDSGIFVYQSCMLEGTQDATAVMIQQGENRFREFKISRGEAGHFYDTNLLSTQAGTGCYNLMLFLHSLNAEASAPGEVVTQFDRKALTDILYKVAGSLTILN